MDNNGNVPRWVERLSIFRQALGRLSDIIKLRSNRTLSEYEHDSLVKRFEFTYEMAWKLMMSYEKDNGISQIQGSRDVVRYAVGLTLIDNGEAWLDMIDARNQTSHLYDEDSVIDIIDDIVHTYYPLFKVFESQMTDIASR